SGRILRVVLTGGPMAGKTSALEWLRRELIKVPTFHNLRLMLTPESATTVYKMGINRCNDLGTDGSRLVTFQGAVFDLQVMMEDLAARVAKQLSPLAEDDIIIIMDRGILDGKGYMTEQSWLTLLAQKNTSECNLLTRYDVVIHLRSIAVENGGLYETLLHTNRVRTETCLQAASQDDKEWLSWQDHPAHIRIDNHDGDWEAKMQLLLQAIVQSFKTRANQRVGG
ncbi:unnamed protein product, partial [Heterosigma akashiwo]